MNFYEKEIEAKRYFEKVQKECWKLGVRIIDAEKVRNDPEILKKIEQRALPSYVAKKVLEECELSDREFSGLLQFLADAIPEEAKKEIQRTKVALLRRFIEEIAGSQKRKGISKWKKKDYVEKALQCYSQWLGEELKNCEEENQEGKKMKEKIKKLYVDFVRSGQFEEARKILKLLQKHRINLSGLDDVTWNVQIALEKIRCSFSYGRSYHLYAYFNEKTA